MKNVKITIKSTQNYENGQKDTAEISTVGTFEKNEDSFIISYLDSSATGFEGCTTTLTVFDNDKVTLLRTGKNNNSDLTIENGKKHHSVYSTVYGDMMIGVNAKSVVSTLTQNGGNIYLNYTVDINSAFISANELYITVEETK